MSRTPPCWPFLPCRLFGMTWRSFPVLFSLFFNPSARSVLVFHLCVFCPDLRSMAPEVWENFRHTHWVVQSSGRRKRVQPALSQETINYTLTPSLFLPPSHFLSPPPWTKEKKKTPHLSLSIVTRDKTVALQIKKQLSLSLRSLSALLSPKRTSGRKIKHSSPSGRVKLPCPLLQLMN